MEGYAAFFARGEQGGAGAAGEFEQRADDGATGTGTEQRLPSAIGALFEQQ